MRHTKRGKLARLGRKGSIDVTISQVSRECETESSRNSEAFAFCSSSTSRARAPASK